MKIRIHLNKLADSVLVLPSFRINWFEAGDLFVVSFNLEWIIWGICISTTRKKAIEIDIAEITHQYMENNPHKKVSETLAFQEGVRYIMKKVGLKEKKAK